MSVTFRPSPETSDVYGWEWECWGTGEPVANVYGTEADAVEGRRSHQPSCASCTEESAYYPGRSFVYPATRPMPEVNVSTGNAHRLLALLGFEFGDGCGEATPVDLLARACFAKIVAGNDHGSVTFSVGNLTDCGRRAGWTDERLEGLSRVVEWARTHDRVVVWS